MVDGAFLGFVFFCKVGFLAGVDLACFFARSKENRLSDLMPKVIITLITNKNSVQNSPKKKLIKRLLIVSPIKNSLTQKNYFLVKLFVDK